MITAVVVPTCRPDRLIDFLDAWRGQFAKHACDVIVVRDDTPDGEIWHYPYPHYRGAVVSNMGDTLGGRSYLVPRKTPACRGAGFAYVAKHMGDVTKIVTLDDDLVPDGDTIGDHLAALDLRVPVSWFSSTAWGSPYMRGFPYGIRGEAPVWVSHGVWKNIPDLDAPSQLVLGESPPVEFYRGPVPKGVEFPLCGMNLAFRRAALPLMYWCPCVLLPGAQRFDDIWMGLHAKGAIDEAGAAIVTGFASCVHTRLSDVFKNLEQEAVGISLNEDYWQSPPQRHRDFFSKYDDMRHQWSEYTRKLL